MNILYFDINIITKWRGFLILYYIPQPLQVPVKMDKMNKIDKMNKMKKIDKINKMDKIDKMLDPIIFPCNTPVLDTRNSGLVAYSHNWWTSATSDSTAEKFQPDWSSPYMEI